MNKLRVFKMWSAFAFLSLLLIFSACQPEPDPLPILTPAEQLQGIWKSEMSGGNWDEYNFDSKTTVTYRYFASEDGSIFKTEYDFAATETKIFFTDIDGVSSVYDLYIKNDELTIGNYLYKKQK